MCEILSLAPATGHKRASKQEAADFSRVKFLLSHVQPANGGLATQSGRDEPAWKPQVLHRPPPYGRWGYLVFFTKLFPPLPLPPGEDEACWGTGRAEDGKADPGSHLLPELPAQTCWQHSWVRACPDAFRGPEPPPRLWMDITTACASGPTPPVWLLLSHLRAETHAPSISGIPLTLPSPLSHAVLGRIFISETPMLSMGGQARPPLTSTELTPHARRLSLNPLTPHRHEA